MAAGHHCSAVMLGAGDSTVTNFEETLARIFFFVPLIIVFFYNIYVCIGVSSSFAAEKERLRHTKIYDMDRSSSTTPSILYTHRIFLLAFAVCWIWGIILAILYFVKKPVPWIFDLNYIFTPLPGLFNACIYGFNDALRKKLSETFSCCGCIYQENTTDDIEADVEPDTTFDNEEFLQWRTTASSPNISSMHNNERRTSYHRLSSPSINDDRASYSINNEERVGLLINT
eukprot:TRINITY_DN4148_c0_g1_i1.p1 TRINITY_DN4148_c0_g1~~TRINITY_DN4148_c0_g1_i1.p1  ORF type:complete len:229 (-),score=33.16 TRINITY_DN4148_c0_g1_i1:139-825(-)